MTYSTFPQESLDAELNLTELQSMSGGIAPIVLGGVFVAVAYAAYKSSKILDQVPQNVNKLSYGGIRREHEDPFGGAFTGKAN